MYTFPELLKKIRKEADLTQEDLANALEVSTILISMVEAGQKDVSKALVVKLADKLGVHPSSIVPFMFIDKSSDFGNSQIEKKLIVLGEKLQEQLINVKAKRLKEYAS